MLNVCNVWNISNIRNFSIVMQIFFCRKRKNLDIGLKSRFCDVKADLFDKRGQKNCLKSRESLLKHSFFSYLIIENKKERKERIIIHCIAYDLYCCYCKLNKKRIFLMEVRSVETFLTYFENIRLRTMKVAEKIPPDRLEWSPMVGKFTCGDILRHIAAIERYMYAENVAGRPSRYAGCGVDLAEGYERTFAFARRLHEESMTIFHSLTDADLLNLCQTPAGAQIPIWKWLRAMVEHEVHHRGQLYVYLGLMGVSTPPIFGLTSEQVAERRAQ